jgi:hypothetical protein
LGASARVPALDLSGSMDNHYPGKNSPGGFRYES